MRFTYRLAALLSFVLTSAVPANSQDKPAFGVITPLSGQYARAGELTRQGIEMALEDEHAEGLLIGIEDSKNEGATAVTAYNRFKAKQPLAIYTFATPSAMALLPMLTRDKVTLLALTSAGPFSVPDDYGIRVIGSAKQDAEATVAAIKRLGKSRVAILKLANDFGEGLSRELHSVIPAETVVIEDSLLPGDYDGRTVLTKMRAANPDIIYLATWAAEAGEWTKQARRVIPGVPLLGASAVGQPDFFSAAGAFADGVYVVGFEDAGCDPSFTARYEQRFGKKPGYLPLRSYDAGVLAVRAIRECSGKESAPECVRASILRGSPKGICFPVTFDKNGDLLDHFVLKQVKEAAFQTIMKLP